jgi:OOP family OmpA-OmpF porin
VTRLQRRTHAAATVALVVFAFAFVVSSRSAQAQNKGFTVERYEPTAAGSWTFSVDHPWYTKSKFFFAGGLTLDYAHDPLVFGTTTGDHFTQREAVIEHSLVGHVDLAASFLDRVLIAFSLPVTLLERGHSVDGAAPLSGGAAGDPRIGALVRLFGQPLRDAFSLHLGIDFWIPISANDNHAGDSTVRVEPKLVLAGLADWFSWSFTAAYQYRPDATIGTLPAAGGNTVGQELRFGLAMAYADVARRFSIGPEATVGTVLSHSHAFMREYTASEILLGARYNIACVVDLGVAGGIGLGDEPGSPDGRVIFRLAYAPYRAGRPAPAAQPYVPPPPPGDRDHDGIRDDDDLCPDVPEGPHPDPDRRGCPRKDSDGDGIFDRDDQCVDVPAGPHPDSHKLGCPDLDTDGDGVFDSFDECKDVAAGLHPDPAHPGCPLSDRDQDQIPDVDDACPDKPGAPNPDPKKNGCPGLVQLKGGQIVIMQPVFFATNQDVILPKSFPVLQAVADALVATPSIKHVAIEGHTDDRGKPEHNMELSDRRARSVMQFLVEHGIDAGRLVAQGFGQTRPITSNRTTPGRAANRRVEFHIIDQPTNPPDDGTAPAESAPPPTTP